MAGAETDTRATAAAPVSERPRGTAAGGSPPGASPAAALPGLLPALPPAAAGPRWRFDVAQLPGLRQVLLHRAFQYALMLPNLFFFMVVILTGIFGTAVGNRNFSIIFVWIVWWALLIMLLIPFGARVWCTMCPIPAFGDWAQRAALVARPARLALGLGWVWPKALRNIWLQNLSFVGVAMFSGAILTRPAVTGWLLLGFMAAALVLSLLYRRRVFCRYVCPVGGFIGLYSMAAPLEVRVKDPEVCLRHVGKECIRGSATAWGCPWLEYPGTLVRNAYCGMCAECLKACPLNNVAVNLRPFGTDLLVPVRHLDEAFKGFIMLAAAVIYSAVMLGPWGWLKDWANLGSGSWPAFLAYAGGLAGTALVVLPGIFLACTWLARLLSGARTVGLGHLFVSLAYATVPLGLMGWIAFSLSFVFINVSYAIPVLSDPFGWGWDLFGTAGYPWTPYVPWLLPYLQVPVLLAGLALSILLASRLAAENFAVRVQARGALLPIAGFLTAVTLVFMWLYLG